MQWLIVLGLYLAIFGGIFGMSPAQADIYDASLYSESIGNGDTKSVTVQVNPRSCKEMAKSIKNTLFKYYSRSYYVCYYNNTGEIASEGECTSEKTSSKLFLDVYTTNTKCKD